MRKLKYWVICGHDRLERINLKLAAILENMDLSEVDGHAGRYKGLWYELNEETLSLTNAFYKKEGLDENKIIKGYNRLLRTDKFEAYVKKNISFRIFNLLKAFHMLRLSGAESDWILMIKNPIDEFVVSYMDQKYGIRYKIKWVCRIWGWVRLILYYRWLALEFMRRGVAFNRKRQAYKLSQEAVWGFSRLTLRNDLLIDNRRFRKEDLLLLNCYSNNPRRVDIFKEAEDRGFKIVSVPDMFININRNAPAFLSFYLFAPVKTYFQSLMAGRPYLFPYMLTFHQTSFPVEVLMNLYDIRYFISTKDWGDVETTIILNKYGAKSAIFNWGDMVTSPACHRAFIAHNLCMAWGDIHYDMHSKNYFVDKKVNVGCIFKKEFKKSLMDRENIVARLAGRLIKGDKVVVFFDTSFSDDAHFTEQFFLEYISLITDFCKTHEGVKVLLKPKSEDGYENRLSPANYGRYKELWSALQKNGNFIYLDPSVWSIEEAIAISDVSVSMGMNSPATIALICGKNALYFDNTGNSYHPFAKKYRGEIVFSDKGRLFGRIEQILNGGFGCADIIKDGEIRQFDAFDDDNVLERIGEHLSGA